MLQSESCIIPRAVQLESKTSRISFSAPTSNHAIMNPSAATFQQVVENELLSRCPNPHARPRYFISRGTLCVPFSNETDVSAFTKQPLSCCCGFCSPPGRSFLVPAATWVAVAFCQTQPSTAAIVGVVQYFQVEVGPKVPTTRPRQPDLQ